MNKNLTRSQYGLLVPAYILMVFSLLFIYGRVIGLEMSLTMQVFSVIVGSMTMLLFIKMPLVFYGLLIFMGIAAIVVERYITEFLMRFVDRALNLLGNIGFHLIGEQQIFPENILWFWLILMVLVTFYTAFLIFAKRRIYWVLPLYLGSFIYYWYIFVDEAYPMTVIFLVAFLVTMGLDKYYEESKVWEDREENPMEGIYRPWIQTVLIYGGLMMIFALALPKSANAIEWNWLEQQVYRVFPFVQEMRSEDQHTRRIGQAGEFDFTLTGYQRETGRLGGPVELSGRVLMNIEATRSRYLRGNVRQTYTGINWETVERMPQTYEIGEDFSNLTPEERETYYDRVEMTITHEAFATQTLFSPYKPVRIEHTLGDEIVLLHDKALRFDDGVYQRESYEVYALAPKPYGQLMVTDIDLKIEDLEYLDEYLQLPDTITERTLDLTEAIVDGIEGDFEKARALERYLREAYDYNTQVPMLPRGFDFVDHFLFESREGYCTYFASAMAVMLRSEGIPARYVEGFIMREESGWNEYQVRQNHGHAWVEAFIEPVGWMTFEATPAFNVPFRQEGFQEGDPTDRPDGEFDNGDRDFDDIEQDEAEDDEFLADDDLIGGSGRPTVDDPDPVIPAAVTRGALIGLLILLMGFLPARLLMGMMQEKMKERRLIEDSRENQVVIRYGNILKRTEKMGFPPVDGETHYEYSRRVAYKLYDDNERGIGEITDRFVKVKYGRDPVSDEDLSFFKEYQDKLDARLKNDWGRRVFYHEKYLKKSF